MTIQIVSSINSAYIQHFCVMAISVLCNTNNSIEFHVINNDLSDDEKKNILENFSKYKNIKFNFYTINDDLLNEIEIQAEHLTIQTLYRLLIPNVLPKSVEKVIYLDSDLIVESDLSELFNIEVEDYYIAAINEIYKPSIKILKLDSMMDYFNAGVMVINLKKWRQNSLTEKCFEFAKMNQEKLLLADQDILNGVLRGNWKRASLEWNLVKGVWNNYDEYCAIYSKPYIDKVINKPNIIHFTTASKPWHLLCEHPYKDRYFHYLNMTGLPYVKYPELQYLRKKDNIYIFGSGKAGQDTLKLLQNKNIKIRGFYDNNRKIWGEKVLEKEVFNPKTIKSNNNDFIIIASMYYEEITKQLVDMGLEEYMDFCQCNHLYKLGVFFDQQNKKI